MRFIWMIISLVLIGISGIEDSFAEQIISTQKTVDVDNMELTYSLSSLENY